MAPSLSVLSTVQIFMDSTFYGCFVMLFTVSVVVLNKRSRRLETRSQRSGEKDDPATKVERNELRFWKTLGTTMIIITTCHWAFAWATVLSLVDNVVLRSQMSFMRFIFEMLSVIIGDALVLSRLWTVGGKRPVVIAFPLLCLLGFIACSIRLADLEAKHLLLAMPNPINIRWWFTATTALTTRDKHKSLQYRYEGMKGTESIRRSLTSNIVYIAWRAWLANKLVHKSIYTYFMHICSIFVESAAIYTIWTCILLGIVAENRTLWSLLLPVSPSLFGCTMMLISVRLGLGWALGLGGQAAKEPRSLAIQFARSHNSESDMSDLEYNYRD
ncbi:hypothetical protein NP233_g11167 [Leucocoprinus birnbaumii]|uniref:Uncharacterized protein n=1 Tax=Leucocoprinus birnbaumii TaxID=56174 RepID=A0AAD5VHD6_9AGAR|nr:hypothetical protein NP233_g11167 [Leucocoprinus birnbaumii]